MWRIAAAGGLSAALATAQFLVPIAGAVPSLFAPLPLLWLVWRAGGGSEVGYPHVAAAGLLAAALPTILVGPAMALGLLVQFGPMAAALALGLARHWAVTPTVAAAAGLTVAVGVAVLLVRSGFDPAAAREAVAAQVERAVTAALARTAGDAVEPEPVAEAFVRLLPGLAVAGTAAGAWANLFLLRWWVTGGSRAGGHGVPRGEGDVPTGGGTEEGAGPAARREGADRPEAAAPGPTRPESGEPPLPPVGAQPPLDDWSRWAAPEPLVFVLVLGGAVLLLGMPAATTLGLNLLLVVGVVYFLQGLAIVGFFFRAKRVPLVLRVAGYLLIGAQQLLALVVAAVGLADLWVDFRRRALRQPR